MTEYNKKTSSKKKLEANIRQKKKQRDKIQGSAFSGFLNFFTGQLDKLISEITRLEGIVLPQRKKAEQDAKKEYEDATIRDVKLFYGYKDKSFTPSKDEQTNQSTRAAKEAGYYEPVPAFPTFEVINGNTFGSLINNTASFQIKRYGKDKIDYFTTRENSMEDELRFSPQMSNYVEQNCSIF